MQKCKGAKVQRFKDAKCKGAKLTAKKNKVTDKQTSKVTSSLLELFLAAKNNGLIGLQKSNHLQKVSKRLTYWTVLKKS